MRLVWTRWNYWFGPAKNGWFGWMKTIDLLNKRIWNRNNLLVSAFVKFFLWTSFFLALWRIKRGTMFNKQNMKTFRFFANSDSPILKINIAINVIEFWMKVRFYWIFIECQISLDYGGDSQMVNGCGCFCNGEMEPNAQSTYYDSLVFCSIELHFVRFWVSRLWKYFYFSNFVWAEK